MTESNIDDFDTLVDDMEFTFPVIAKTNKGSRGDGVFIFHHKECLKCIAKYLIKNSNNLGFNSIIVQERIEADSDFRVNVFRKSKSATFTNNDEYIVVSAIKRNKKQGEYRTNTSLGSQLENATPSENVKNAAIQAAKSVKSVWCGVDVICDNNGNAYALEVNYIPYMKGAFSTNS